eukprot:Nk52_evm1s1941 gene=Nk52_evmTU1s1941
MRLAELFDRLRYRSTLPTLTPASTPRFRQTTTGSTVASSTTNPANNGVVPMDLSVAHVEQPLAGDNYTSASTETSTEQYEDINVNAMQFRGRLTDELRDLLRREG